MACQVIYCSISHFRNHSSSIIIVAECLFSWVNVLLGWMMTLLWCCCSRRCLLWFVSMKWVIVVNSFANFIVPHQQLDNSTPASTQPTSLNFPFHYPSCLTANNLYLSNYSPTSQPSSPTNQNVCTRTFHHTSYFPSHYTFLSFHLLRWRSFWCLWQIRPFYWIN